MKRLFSALIAITLMIACTKTKKSNLIPYPDLTPFAIHIEITKGGVILPDSILKNIKISYYAFGTKNYLVDNYIFKDVYDTTKTIISTIEAYDLSSLTYRPATLSFPKIPGTEYNASDAVQVNVPPNPIAEYYIEYPNGLKTDTMYLVTSIQNGEQAIHSSCGCSDPPPLELKFNGVIAPLDTVLTLKGGRINSFANIYLLNK